MPCSKAVCTSPDPYWNNTPCHSEPELNRPAHCRSTASSPASRWSTRLPPQWHPGKHPQSTFWYHGPSDSKRRSDFQLRFAAWFCRLLHPMQYTKPDYSAASVPLSQSIWMISSGFWFSTLCQPHQFTFVLFVCDAPLLSKTPTNKTLNLLQKSPYYVTAIQVFFPTYFFKLLTFFRCIR